MKKKIALIIALSLVFVGVFGYLTQREYVKAQEYFEEDGYILIPDESGQGTNVLCNFTSGTKYQTSSYDNKIVFSDINNSKVAIDTNNFIHYSSDSLAGLSDTVLLDTDSLNAEQISYYSLTSRSKLTKTGDGYVTSNAGENVEFSNFIWKTSSERYMVVSDTVTLVVSEESQQVFNGYLEVEYVDEGVVHLVNQDGTYSTISSDAYLELANGIRVYLGSKNVSDGENIIVNMAQMVVNSDDNIEIIPDEEYKNENVKQPQIIVNATDGQDGEDGNVGEDAINGESGQNGNIGGAGTPGGFGSDGKNGIAGLSGLSAYQQYIKDANIEGILDYNEWKTQVTNSNETYNSYVQERINELGLTNIKDYNEWYKDLTGETGLTGNEGKEGLTAYYEYVAANISYGSGLKDYYTWLEEKDPNDTEDYNTYVSRLDPNLSYDKYMDTFFKGQNGGDGRGGISGSDGDDGTSGKYSDYTFSTDKMPKFFIINNGSSEELYVTPFSVDAKIGYEYDQEIFMNRDEESVDFLIVEASTNSVVYKRSIDPDELAIYDPANPTGNVNLLTGELDKPVTRLKQNTQYKLLVNASYYTKLDADKGNTEYRYQNVYSRDFTTGSIGLNLSFDHSTTNTAVLNIDYSEKATVDNGITAFQVYLYQEVDNIRQLIFYSSTQSDPGRYYASILNEQYTQFDPPADVNEINGKMFGLGRVTNKTGQINVEYSKLTPDTKYYALIVIPNSAIPFSSFELLEFETLKIKPDVEPAKLTYQTKNNTVVVEPGLVTTDLGDTQFNILEYRYDFYEKGDEENNIVLSVTKKDLGNFVVPVGADEKLKLDNKTYYCITTVVYQDNDNVKKESSSAKSNDVTTGNILWPTAEITFKKYSGNITGTENNGKAAPTIIDANVNIIDKSGLIDKSQMITITVEKANGTEAQSRTFDSYTDEVNSFDFAFGDLTPETQYVVKIIANKLVYKSNGNDIVNSNYTLCTDTIKTGSYTPLYFAGDEVDGSGFGANVYFTLSDDALEEEKRYGFEFSQAARDILGQGLQSTYDFTLRSLDSVGFKIFGVDEDNNIGTAYNVEASGLETNDITMPNTLIDETVRKQTNDGKYDFYNDSRFLYVEGKTNELVKNYLKINNNDEVVNTTLYSGSAVLTFEKVADNYIIKYNKDNSILYLNSTAGRLTLVSESDSATKWTVTENGGKFNFKDQNGKYLVFDTTSKGWSSSLNGYKDISIYKEDNEAYVPVTSITDFSNNTNYKLFIDSNTSNYANKLDGNEKQYFNGLFPKNYVKNNNTGFPMTKGQFYVNQSDVTPTSESYVIYLSGLDMPGTFDGWVTNYLSDKENNNYKNLLIKAVNAIDKKGNKIPIGICGEGNTVTNDNSDRFLLVAASNVPPTMKEGIYLKTAEFNYYYYNKDKSITDVSTITGEYDQDEPALPIGFTNPAYTANNASGNDISNLENGWANTGLDKTDAALGFVIKDTDLSNSKLSWLIQYADAVKYYIYEKPVEKIFNDGGLYDNDNRGESATTGNTFDNSGFITTSGWITANDQNTDNWKHLPYYTVYFGLSDNGKTVERGKEYTIAFEVQLKSKYNVNNNPVIFPKQSTGCQGALSTSCILSGKAHTENYRPDVTYLEYLNGTANVNSYRDEIANIITTKNLQGSLSTYETWKSNTSNNGGNYEKYVFDTINANSSVDWSSLGIKSYKAWAVNNNNKNINNLYYFLIFDPDNTITPIGDSRNTIKLYTTDINNAESYPLTRVSDSNLYLYSLFCKKYGELNYQYLQYIDLSGNSHFDSGFITFNDFETVNTSNTKISSGTNSTNLIDNYISQMGFESGQLALMETGNGIGYIPKSETEFYIFLQIDCPEDLKKTDNGNETNNVIENVKLTFTNRNDSTKKATITTSDYTLVVRRSPGSSNEQVIQLVLQYSDLSNAMSTNGDSYYDLDVELYFDTGNYGAIYTKNLSNDNELEMLLNKYNATSDVPLSLSEFNDVYDADKQFYKIIDNVEVINNVTNYRIERSDQGNYLFKINRPIETEQGLADNWKDYATMSSSGTNNVPFEIQKTTSSLDELQQARIAPTMKLTTDAGMKFFKFDIDYSCGSIDVTKPIYLYYWDGNTWKEVESLTDGTTNAVKNISHDNGIYNSDTKFNSGVVTSFKLRDNNQEVIIDYGKSYKFKITGQYPGDTPTYEDFKIDKLNGEDANAKEFTIKTLDEINILVTSVNRISNAKDAERNTTTRNTKKIAVTYDIIDTHIKDIKEGVENINICIDQRINDHQDIKVVDIAVSKNDIIQAILNKYGSTYSETEKATLENQYLEFSWEPKQQSTIDNVSIFEHGFDQIKNIVYPTVTYTLGTTNQEKVYKASGKFITANWGKLNQYVSGINYFTITTSSNYEDKLDGEGNPIINAQGKTQKSLYVQFDVSAFDPWRIITGGSEKSARYIVELYKDDTLIDFNLSRNLTNFADLSTKLKDVNYGENETHKVLVIDQDFTNGTNLNKIEIRQSDVEPAKNYTIKIYTILDGGNIDLAPIELGTQNNGIYEKWTDYDNYSTEKGNDKALIISTVTSRNSDNIVVTNAQYDPQNRRILVNGIYLEDINMITYQFISTDGQPLSGIQSLVNDGENQLIFNSNYITTETENQRSILLPTDLVNQFGSNCYLKVVLFATPNESKPVAWLDAKISG